jgi:hypothetical protein
MTRNNSGDEKRQYGAELSRYVAELVGVFV